MQSVSNALGNLLFYTREDVNSVQASYVGCNKKNKSSLLLTRALDILKEM